MLLVVDWIFESNSPSCWKVFFYVTSLSPGRKALVVSFINWFKFCVFCLFFTKEK